MDKILPTKPGPRQPLHHPNKLNKRPTRPLSPTNRAILLPNQSRRNKNNIKKTNRHHVPLKTSRIKTNIRNAAITAEMPREELDYPQAVIACFWQV